MAQSFGPKQPEATPQPVVLMKAEFELAKTFSWYQVHVAFNSGRGKSRQVARVPKKLVVVYNGNIADKG